MTPAVGALPALLAAALLVSILAVAAASSGAPHSGPPLKFDFLVFPEGCLAKFLGGHVFDAFCLKRTISKVLGYGIITGACIVKLPQILRFVAAGSVRGISRWATYMELLGYLLGSIYHVVLVREGDTIYLTTDTSGWVGGQFDDLTGNLMLRRPDSNFWCHFCCFRARVIGEPLVGLRRDHHCDGAVRCHLHHDVGVRPPRHGPHSGGVRG